MATRRASEVAAERDRSCRTQPGEQLGREDTGRHGSPGPPRPETERKRREVMQQPWDRAGGGRSGEPESTEQEAE